ncbi:MAG TPA: oligosaccharide flippase family protein [Patescibacteria group bacterium]|nr:oligosaccharide flippase family protein [Patescibacteria group bacterium]
MKPFKTIGTGLVWNVVTTYASKLVGFGTIFIILSRLSAYEYGVAELALSITVFMSIFLLPGLSNVVIVDMGVEKGAGNSEKAQGMFVAYFKLVFSLGIVAWALVFFGASFIAQYSGEYSSYLVKIVSFTLVMAPIRSLYTILFSYALRYAELSFIGFFEELIKLVMVLAFLVQYDNGPGGLLWATVASQVGALILLAPKFYQIYKQSFSKNPMPISITTLFTGHSFWSILGTYIGSFGQSMRTWIVKFMLGTEAVAQVNVAFGLIGHTQSLMPLSKVIAPLLPQYMYDKIKFVMLLVKSIKYQFIGQILVTIPVCLFIPIFIRTFFGEYTQAVPIFYLFIPMLITSGFDVYVVAAFMSLKAQKNMLFAVFYKVILTALILPICIQYYGIYGVPLGLFLVSCWFVYERYTRLKKILPEFALHWKDIIRYDEFDALILRRIWAMCLRFTRFMHLKIKN